MCARKQTDTHTHFVKLNKETKFNKLKTINRLQYVWKTTVRLDVNAFGWVLRIRFINWLNFFLWFYHFEALSYYGIYLNFYLCPYQGQLPIIFLPFITTSIPYCYLCPGVIIIATITLPITSQLFFFC